MKKPLKALITATALLLLAACSKTETSSSENKATTTTTTEVTAVAEVTETCKMSQEVDGVTQDIYFDITYAGDEYKTVTLRYESYFGEDLVSLFQEQGRETVEANLNEELDALIPGVNAIKELEGVDVTSVVDDSFVWKLTIALDPKLVNFDDLATKGDSFAFLSDITDITPKQFVAGLSIAGFEKVTE